MRRAEVDDSIRPKPPLTVELVGLAGTGKTTLLKALSQQDARILASSDLELRKIKYIPVFLKQVPSLLPMLAPRSRSDRWLTWDEIKAMAYLRGWPGILSEPTMNQGLFLLLDQGPIFKLATLNAFGPQRVKDRALEQWWHPVLEQWAARLDMVIWLTAPIEILIERIRARAKRHAMKESSRWDAQQYLERYQASYEQVAGKLVAMGGPTLQQIDTSQMTIEQTLEEISLTLSTLLESNGQASCSPLERSTVGSS